MPTGVLLDPNNRLLGGATGDFSLYGAQPAVLVGPARPPTPDPTLLTVPSSPAAAGPVVQTAPFAQEFADTGTPASVDPGPSASPALALQSAQTLAAVGSPTDFATLAPQVASSIGSGSPPPLVADTAIPAIARAVEQAEAPAASSGGVAPGGLAASLAAPVIATGEQASFASNLLAPAALALAAPALDTSVATIGPVVAGAVTSAVGAEAAGAVALLDGGLPVSAVEATVAPVVAAVPAADAVTETITATAVAAVETLADAAATAADLTAAPVDDLPLGGSDPAAGVTTLVSMVETAAVFEIAEPAPQPEAAAGGSSIIDALAADDAPEALLGDAAAAVDSLISQHDDGLPGSL